MSTMLYKKGTTHKLHGLMCDYIVTDEPDDELKNGWCKSPAEAHAEKKKPKKVKK